MSQATIAALSSPRAQGVYGVVVGTSATVGGVIAIDTGIGATAGTAGIILGVPMALAGLTEVITGKPIPTSPGDVVAQQTNDPALGAYVDLSLLLIDPESLFDKPDSITDVIGKIDAAKTINDSVDKINAPQTCPAK